MGTDLDIRAGDHVCGFYWGVSGRDELMLPYLLEGLRAGEPCICVVHATDPDDVLHKLGASLDVESLVASGHLDVRPSSEAYVRGGRFTVTEMVAVLQQYLAVAAADGGTARVAGEGAWAVEGYPGVEQLIDYEIELNRMVRRHRPMILCLYDLEALGGALVVDLLRTHPKIIVAGMPFDNPNYLTPEEFSTARGSNARPGLG